MHYWITYTCGHTGMVSLVGKDKEKKQRLEWLATCVCPDCYRKQQQPKTDKANKGLCELKGSEKQIAWAKIIRAKLINHQKGWQLFRSKGEKYKQVKTPKGLLDVVSNEIMKINSAKWWIEHRDDNWDDIILWAEQNNKVVMRWMENYMKKGKVRQ